MPERQGRTWLARYELNSRDYERTTASSEAVIYICMINLRSRLKSQVKKTFLSSTKSSCISIVWCSPCDSIEMASNAASVPAAAERNATAVLKALKKRSCNRRRIVMPDKDGEFRALSVGELKEAYYSTKEHLPSLILNPENVPEILRSLIPLAQRWGISDDVLRFDAVRNATPADIEYLRQCVDRYNSDLDEWLAGPEADACTFSQEYLAFSNMRMAADGA